LFSFRYHAISLVAVFLALGIGVLLGVSIGEEGIVSSARKDLENSLRGDLNNARSRNSELSREVQVRDDFEHESYSGLVGGLMPGFRIGIVAIGDLPSGYAPAVREAVQPAGAEVDSVSVIRTPPSLDRLATSLKGTRLAGLGDDSDKLTRFGKRIGRQLAHGGSLLQKVRDDLFSSSHGEYRGLDGIVWVRDRNGLKGDDKTVTDQFETALIDGMRATKVQLVGVEMRDTDPSQIPVMKDQGLTTVDDLDLVAGQAALAYGLLGADGQFGVKDSADQLLPPPPTSSERSR
jgi:Copper transport outer membrane protein, MctB